MSLRETLRWALPAIAWCVLFVAVVFTLSDTVIGQDTDVEHHVPAGARGLRSGGFPWYDAGEEELVPIDKPSERQQRNWQGPRLNLGPMFSQILQIAFIVILVALLCGLVYLLIRAFLKREGDSEASGELVKVLTDEARIEELPFNVREPNRDLLEQARLHYDRGEFNEAIVYLYSYMLLHLDKNQIIRLSKGKTNRQYLRELNERPTLSGLLERTMVAFEEAFFGSHQLQRDDFEGCWSQLDRFHQSVTEAAG